MRLLVAIPVFNERKYVDQVLNKVRRFASDILVVDDGSTDGTAELLAARADIQLRRHATNSGYGSSLIDAFNFADSHGYDWVITMDCDEQHEPEMIPAFVRKSKRTMLTSSAVRGTWNHGKMMIFLRGIAEQSTPPSPRC